MEGKKHAGIDHALARVRGGGKGNEGGRPGVGKNKVIDW